MCVTVYVCVRARVPMCVYCVRVMCGLMSACVQPCLPCVVVLLTSLLQFHFRCPLTKIDCQYYISSHDHFLGPCFLFLGSKDPFSFD